MIFMLLCLKKSYEAILMRFFLFCLKDSNANSYGVAFFFGNFTISIIRNSNFISNSASYGGVLFVFEASAIIENSLFSKNSAEKSGGALYVSASALEIVNTHFERNKGYNNS